MSAGIVGNARNKPGLAKIGQKGLRRLVNRRPAFHRMNFQYSMQPIAELRRLSSRIFRLHVLFGLKKKGPNLADSIGLGCAVVTKRSPFLRHLLL